MISAEHLFGWFLASKYPNAYGKEAYSDAEEHKIGLMQIRQNLTRCSQVFNNSVQAPPEMFASSQQFPKKGANLRQVRGAKGRKGQGG